MISLFFGKSSQVKVMFLTFSENKKVRDLNLTEFSEKKVKSNDFRIKSLLGFVLNWDFRYSIFGILSFRQISVTIPRPFRHPSIILRSV